MALDNKLIEVANNVVEATGETAQQEILIKELEEAINSKISRYDDGVKDENERFWKTIQTKLAWYSGKGFLEERRTDYNYAFRQWYTAKEIKPLYPLEVTSVTTMFESCQSLESLPPITFLQPISTYAMCNGCLNLKEINMDMRLTGNCSAMFNSCQNLTKVNKLIIEGTCTWNSMSFAGCKKLVELNIEGTIDTTFVVSDCESLNRASIENIVNILSPDTNNLACTFSKIAVNNAFTPDEWQALTDTKTNWNIGII